MSRYENFVNALPNVDWYHAGRKAPLEGIAKNGINEPEVPEPGVRGPGIYGPGLNLASNPEHVNWYRDRAANGDESAAGVLQAKLQPRNPLIFADRIGIVTPQHQERLMKALYEKKARIADRVKNGEFSESHGDYLHEKVDRLMHGVRHNDSIDIGQAAPHAGFDAYITDDHQLDTNDGLQAVVNSPRALRPIRVHDSKQFSELFKRPE